MIDFELSEKLKQKYSPEGSELRKVQLKLLDMLLWIDKTCKDNNIKYWISSGTCLGAVRHGGFIPWDDDIDIEMTQEDYKHFEEVVTSMKNCPYVFQSHSTDPGYYHNFGKLRDEHFQINEINSIDKYYKFKGIFIDIFVVVPKMPHWIARIGEIMYGRCRKYSKHPKKQIRNFVQYFLFPIVHHCIRHLLVVMCKKDKKEYSMQFGMPIWKPRFSKDIQEPVPILFENHYFMGPRDPDKYLTNIYGDYTKIPEEKDIILHYTV